MLYDILKGVGILAAHWHCLLFKILASGASLSSLVTVEHMLVIVRSTCLVMII